MLEATLDVLINTFCFDSHLGSQQYLHFFSDQYKLHNEAANYEIYDEYDHSFIHIENPALAHVLWKNKAGQIQFCGSGAYALAWIMGEIFPLSQFEIKSEFIKLNSRYIAKDTLLEFDAKQLGSIVQYKGRKIYFNVDSGLYFVSVNNHDEVNDDSLLKTYQLYIEKTYANDVHGFCAFYWDGTREGYLRYFTPWHGRDEDYVTGSIHQYLTPLVYSLFKVQEQTWTQVSHSKGRLHSSYLNNTVCITGQCTFKPNQALNAFLLGNTR